MTQAELQSYSTPLLRELANELDELISLGLFSTTDLQLSERVNEELARRENA